MADPHWKDARYAPDDVMLLVTDDNWPPAKLRGEKPPVKVGYIDKRTGLWTVFGASWQPTRFREVPYPEDT
ncbi:hypothetical protein EVB27_088 [Rhizobium phage RHph_TM16]|nr:hypothetical protein EVB27_088 [Rhizobium phage RHph_TM16]